MMLKSYVNFLLQTTAFISFLLLVISYNAVFYVRLMTWII